MYKATVHHILQFSGKHMCRTS